MQCYRGRNIAKRAANGQAPRYWRPDRDPPFEVPHSDIRIYALGPPHDAKLIRMVLPSTDLPETDRLMLDGRGIFSDGVRAALASSDDDMPFADNWTIPIEQGRGMPFFQNRYWGAVGEGEKWRRVDDDWLRLANDLALALQGITNNASLVLAVELAGGDVLLFASDAHLGNWLSWQDLKYSEANHTKSGLDLLARTVFYKVAHHGSQNATLREHGLDMMTNLRVAVIPVDKEVAVKMRWADMPSPSLITALKEKTGGRALRTDIAPLQPIDRVSVTDLYYEIVV